MNLNSNKNTNNQISNAPSQYWPESYKKSVEKKVKKNQKYNSANIPVYKKFPKMYLTSFCEYLPFFIGWLISLVRSNLAYGRMRSTTCFNKEIYKKFRKRIFLCNILHIIFGPCLFLVIIFIQPLFTVSLNSYNAAWNNFFTVAFGPGDFGTNFGNAFNQFSIDLIVPTYNSAAWLYGLILLAAIPIVNFSQIFSSIILNFQTKNYIQTLVTEDSLKIKISRLRKNKIKI